ncbi:MAG: tRNA epoxyqueuosine(34) reductase QueG [Planctomycetia bacterium]|nr:tRNA epoxyqueuosine(34) reductase QueG [Planctomycetia bacterium]
MDVREMARKAGLARVGSARLRSLPDAENLRAFFAEGRHATMEWMREDEARRSDAAAGFGWARSIVIAALPYPAEDEGLAAPGHGRVARYARGEDYHRVMRKRLDALAAAMRAGGARCVAVVDTSALMEKAWAREAGIGWIGKNTCSIDAATGSWFVLGALLTDLDLEPDAPAEDRCGACTLCLETCPTGALTGEYRMDARRCISYLTIEHVGPIEPELRRGMGDWVFGCDVCQEVCPFNRGAAGDPALAPRAGLTSPRLADWLRLDADGWEALTRATALRRTKLPELRRNAAIAAANAGHRELLEEAARDADPVVAEIAREALKSGGA